MDSYGHRDQEASKPSIGGVRLATGDFGLAGSSGVVGVSTAPVSEVEGASAAVTAHMEAVAVVPDGPTSGSGDNPRVLRCAGNARVRRGLPPTRCFAGKK